MRNRTRAYFVLLLLIMFAVNVLGCSKLFGPSDEEVIKAINDTGLFSGGVEKFSLKSPIVILEKNIRGDDSWQVKVRMTVTYTMAGGHETKPTEKIQSFRISNSKDGSGNTLWKAEAAS